MTLTSKDQEPLVPVHRGGAASAAELRRHSGYQHNLHNGPSDTLTGMQDGSEQLQQETHEALLAKLSLEGIQDIRAMLCAVDEGRSLHPLHLTAVASTLLAAASVEESIPPQ